MARPDRRGFVKGPLLCRFFRDAGMDEAIHALAATGPPKKAPGPQIAGIGATGGGRGALRFSPRNVLI